MAKALLVAILIVVCPALEAGVIVNTSISLTNLQILPASGTLDLLSPLTASAYASVFNSLGGADSQFNTIDNGATSASASTAYATANTAASATALTTSASNAVNLPGIDATAGTVGPGPYGSLCGGNVAPCFNAGGFEIMDSSGAKNPVSVVFNSTLSYSQLLVTNAYGLSASSEVIFQLDLPDIGQMLFLDNPLSISGPNQNAVAAGNPVLSMSTTLVTNTVYSLFIEADAESSGVDSRTPEPSSIFLAAAGLAMLLATRARLRVAFKLR
jgi:hypothetical protein